MRLFRTSLFIGLLLLAPAVHADTGVIYYSQPGDYIGGGVGQQQTAIVTGSGSNTLLTFSFSGFTATFKAPAGEQLVTGKGFPGATRYPFNSATRPGLSVSGNGRGCNTLTGWFEIKEALYDGSGQPARIAIDFKQNCEGGTSALIGAIRYNSNLPTELPTAVAIAGTTQSIMGNQAVVLNGGASFVGTGGTTPVYQWTQVSGPSVTLNGANTYLADFVAPLVPPGGEDLVFLLTVSSGPDTPVDTDSVTIKVTSKTDPQTYIQFNSDAGDYIGGGQSRRYTPVDGSFAPSQNYRGGVTVNFNGSSWWTLSFGPPQGTPFAEGTYTGAQRFAFAAAGSPGMDISGDGRGCNTISGQFTVNAIQFTGIVVDRYAADFEQHCEGGTAALRGQVRWNYVEPGAPVASAGIDQEVLAAAWVALDGSGSSDDEGLVVYRWRQLLGPAVVLQDANTASASFVAPTVTEDTVVRLELLVADAGELTAADVVDILVKPQVGAVGNARGGSGGGLDPVNLLLLAVAGFWLMRQRRRGRN